MSGIVSYGAYVPFNRLQRSTVAKALESRGGKGERAVASFDEDTITMAVEAARLCMRDQSKDAIHALTFATTNAPYQEKLNAATVHAALSLPATTRAQDQGGSVRAGLSSFIAATEAAAAGNSLVAMSDLRMGAPEGAAELNGGDAAAAFQIGNENLIAEVVGTYSETLEHEALWRLPGEKFAKTWEDRFGITQIYVPLLGRAVQSILESTKTAPDSLAAIVIDAPNPRAVAAVLKQMKATPEATADAFLESVGHTGTAHAGLMLAAALDNAKPGDLILVASVSDGVDAVLLKATDAIASYESASPVRAQVESKHNDLGYNRYLKWREILPFERPRRPDPSRPAAPPVFRNRGWKFGFIGSECQACKTQQLPPQVVCVKCGAQDMQPVSFAEKTATVNTYAVDRIAYTLNPPMVMAMLDFEGGGRVELEVTDCDAETVDIGNELEMTFRRFYTADGVHNYFWKSRPIR